MKEAYTIKKGRIFNQEINIPFDFGIAILKDGIYFFEFHVNESYNLTEHMRKNTKQDLFYTSLEMECLTEDNNKLSSYGLSTTQIAPAKSKLSMTCFGGVVFEDISLDPFTPKEELDAEFRQPIYFVELEGLKMQFLDLTEIEHFRHGVKVESFNSKRDHTNAKIIYNGSSNSPCNSFNLTFSPSQKNENNIILEFNGDFPNILYYDVFNEFKEDFIELLSLLNGAEIRIRKEFIGRHSNVGHFTSQKHITYSFKSISNEKYSQYVPINSPFHKTERIISNTFTSCFDKYIELNKDLDFNSIIFYLNGAENANSIMEQLFTKIIAFERLATINYKLNSKQIHSLVTPEQLETIKKEISPIIKKYSEQFTYDYRKVNSRITNIYKENSSYTEDKLYFLLQTANITPDTEIDYLIKTVRNTVIHEGKLEDLKDAVKYCFLVDKLLRDIILNLIGYTGSRNDRRDWFIE